jgi:hypothetical protein
MLTIHKYPIDLEAGSVQSILMHQGAQILDVQSQNGTTTVWAQVDNTQPQVKRRIHFCGTGSELIPTGRYIATVQLRGGFLVLHFFDMGEVV